MISLPDQNAYLRVAAIVPALKLADTRANADETVRLAHELHSLKVDLAVYPEMSLTGYTCADLFHNRELTDGALDALADVAARTADLNICLVVGLPVVYNDCMYNCAAFTAAGRVIAFVPKSYIPNYNEFYERRWWRSGANIKNAVIGGIPFGTDILVDVKGTTVSAEICEDLWVPVPPSCHAAMAGAEVTVNLSASDAITGKYDYLERLISQQSGRCMSGYVYASAGYGESSTDLVFDGIAIIAADGTTISRNKRWQMHPQYSVADIDVAALRRNRMHLGSFGDCAERENATPFRHVDSGLQRRPGDSSSAPVNPLPFVPADGPELDDRCEEIINIQTAGLCRRLDFTNCRSLVVGISGGLDSTLALLVAVNAFDRLGLDRKGILGVTMPGFGTTDRTHSNAVRLMELLGISIKEISIVPAVEQHFRDIGHDPDNHDVTYENSQARQRTYLLMDLANQSGGMVLGTGDLSELALGWATYNGDHMSMYGVNAGVPKTLVRHLVRWFASKHTDVRDVLLDIADTPISPELIPAEADGTIKQKTEDLVGPYELHDFFLYYMLRYGYSPARIYNLANRAFGNKFTPDVIKHWLRTFYRRFFSQQFKRSCLPDGPKVGSVCLSPRGDWRMPSDSSAALWLAEVEKL